VQEMVLARENLEHCPGYVFVQESILPRKLLGRCSSNVNVHGSGVWDIDNELV